MSQLEQAVPGTSVAQPAPAAVVSISIIIPALNEEKMIGRCLESLTRLAYARDRFEVLVVDNGSRDRTVAIAESFKERLNLKVLQQAGVRISALRNLGARAASGDILAFLDADCLAPTDWLDSIFALSPANDAGVSGCALSASGRFILGRKNLAPLSGSTQIGRSIPCSSGRPNHAP